MILAIIALIAVPIVLNIIDDTKENATLRSADFYLHAVELSVVQAPLKNQNVQDGTYNILENGNICLKYTDTTCTEELVVEVNGKAPKSGTITTTSGNITGLNITLNEKELYKNSKNEMVYVKLLDEVCELKSGTAKTAGAKYECKVDPNKDPYTFYVLTTPSSTDERINLIMDRNICSDGTPTAEGKTCFVAYINQTHYLEAGGTKADCDNFRNLNTFGPITAMNYLQEATKDWTNTNEMTINTYTDHTGTIHDMKTYNIYARMPIYSSDATKTEVANFNNNNGYLYEYLDGGDWEYDESTKPENNISGIKGYWTFPFYADYSDVLAPVYYCGFVYHNVGNADDSGYGVRPVINLKL